MSLASSSLGRRETGTLVMTVNISCSNTLIGHGDHVSVVSTDVPLFVLVAAMHALQRL